MDKATTYINDKLSNRKQENAFRELKTNQHLVDFCSNDYLGFAKEAAIHQTNQHFENFGATGSRLISGNHSINEEIEAYLANFYKTKAALIFNSGYNANVGLFQCLPQRSDTIIYDEYIHASIRDGIKLSNAKNFAFEHNNLDTLEQKLTQATGIVYVVIESIYSMDGDQAPLKEITQLCKKHNATLIVDEAHAVGIFGNGLGLVAALNLEKDVFARVITFGKAYGAHGAAVLGSNALKEYLINYSRAFIYTTALPLTSISVIQNAHEFLINHPERIEQLKKNIAHFQKLASNFQLPTYNSNSAIQCLITPGNNEVKELANNIQKHGFDVRPILSPTVPKGKERLRICLHSFNTIEQIDRLITHLNPPLREEISPLEGRPRGVIQNNFYNKNLKSFARDNRKKMTQAEVKIWNNLLRNKQCLGLRFLRQRPVLDYIVDFMCAELKLIVEIDGFSHQFDKIYKNDLKRQKILEKHGFTFLRFDDNEVMNDFDNVIRTFEIYLEDIKK